VSDGRQVSASYEFREIVDVHLIKWNMSLQDILWNKFFFFFFQLINDFYFIEFSMVMCSSDDDDYIFNRLISFKLLLVLILEYLNS
jgi:hypothetical protein